MKNLRPTTLAFLLLALPDLAFSPLYLAACAAILSFPWEAAIGFGAPVFVVRTMFHWWLVRRALGPTETVQARAASGRPITAESLREADRKLGGIHHGVCLVTAISWGLQVPLVVLLYQSLIGPLALHADATVPLGLLTFAGMLGTYAENSPLFDWQLGPAAARNHLLAAEHGIDLERRESTVAHRIASLGLCLVLAPIMIMMASGYTATTDGAFATAHAEAAGLTAELRRADTAAPERLAALALELEPQRTTAFLVVPGHEPVIQGGRLPSELTPPILATAVEHQPAFSDRRLALHAARLPNGMIVGAVVKAEDPDRAETLRALAVLLVLGLWGPLCALLLSQSVATPLRRAGELLRRAVEIGDLSALGTLPVAANNEIGLMTHRLNGLLDSMRTLAAAAGKVGGGQLDVELAGDGELPEAFRQMLERLRAVVQEIHGTSSELAAAATEIFAATQEQEAATTSHSAGMAEITQTMSSLTESAAHVAGAVGGVLENAERTLANTDQMVLRIDELSARANRIGDILEVIRDIADRTDLLALNGSLEATRAGEAGLGFSLVASEMRRLAERVTASVADIKTLVADIRESGASTVVATEESRKLAASTTHAARGIALVTQQQQSSTEQVTDNVRAIAEVVQQAATATTQTRSSAEDLKQHADRLAELVRSFTL